MQFQTISTNGVWSVKTFKIFNKIINFTPEDFLLSFCEYVSLENTDQTETEKLNPKILNKNLLCKSISASFRTEQMIITSLIETEKAQKIVQTHIVTKISIILFV